MDTVLGKDACEIYLRRDQTWKGCVKVLEPEKGGICDDVWTVRRDDVWWEITIERDGSSWTCTSYFHLEILPYTYTRPCPIHILIPTNRCSPKISSRSRIMLVPLRWMVRKGAEE